VSQRAREEQWKFVQGRFALLLGMVSVCVVGTGVWLRFTSSRWAAFVGGAFLTGSLALVMFLIV
jgi:hypothetical protein